jgi:hypothetical protein
MKSKLVGLLMLGAALVPNSAFAGWGAIACDVDGSGACGTSAGYPTLISAEWRAIAACRAAGYDCYVWGWEHDMCKYGPNGSWACN